MRRVTSCLIFAMLLCPAAMAADVGFWEEFALADNREEALKQLIPGTKDYYYYHCLHYQNEGQYDKVDQLLKSWIKRYNRTDRVREIENRQALLRYEQQPGRTLEYLRQRLGLHFSHQRESVSKPNLPTALDPNRISRATLTKRAMDLHSRTTDGFEDRALEWASTLELSPERRRHLLGRLRRPDIPNLPKLVVDDLNHRDSRGFGSMEIHKLLLLDQLEECLTLKPELRNETLFVQVYLTKLHPNPDVDWERDAPAREAYLERLWTFVSTLNPAHNSLKAHVLYHRLRHDRKLGVYDAERLLTYLKLPRNVPYANSAYINHKDRRDYKANLSQDYRQFTLFPPVGNDESLVRAYLMHFFVKADSYKPYDTYLRDTYLKPVFAETKIVNGLGDMERWYSWMSPSQYQALKDRIDIDFAPTNKERFAPDDPVSLDLFVKNVKSLIVKVYEINTINYFRENQRRLDTDINLDGLVPNWEFVHEYKEPPLRRMKRHFDFDMLKKRGAYVVEFIGNGKSSRALIVKGRLRFLMRRSVAGHVFTVLDEKNQHLKDARIWLAGQEYSADKEGLIAVPYSNKPGAQAIVLSHGDFASLDRFDHEAENYQLTAGIHVDREALLRRQTAEVMVRPALYLNGELVTLSVLEQVKLAITSVDREGVSSTKEVRDFKLFEDRESTYEFKVPENLKEIAFTLSAKVKNLSQNKTIDLADSQRFTANGIDLTEKIEDLHVLHVDGAYYLDLAGKTGEAKPERAVEFWIKHRDFRDQVHAVLQTDDRGRIGLGRLNEIAWIKARGPEKTEHQWTLAKNMHSQPRTLHGRAGDTVRVPYMGGAAKVERAEFSLLEKRGATFFADRLKALRVKDGFLEISDLPRGDYDLLLKDSGSRIQVRLTEGRPGHGYILSDQRQLQVRNTQPLQIAGIDAGDTSVTIRLANVSKHARVHVIATRYVPAYDAYRNLGKVAFPEPIWMRTPKAESIFLSGRNIGDEYRYIIDRKYASKYPGNMLRRPELLLNPWDVRKTETGQQEARAGEEWRAADKKSRGSAAGAAPAERPQARQAVEFADLDFLAEQSMVLANLLPDKKGEVVINRKDLGAHQQLHVVAVDPLNTVYRELSLPEPKALFRDLRLANGLDPKRHYTEQKQISILQPRQDLTIKDVTTSKFEAFDTLAKVYKLYATLSGDATLIEFGFVLRWPELKDEERREKYMKYACHELNFFLYHKDPEFFQKVIKPYLANKKDKTFFDRFLLGEDLSDYLKPWKHAQLNIVERILLAERVAAQRPASARHVKDLYDLIPPNIDHFNHLFKTALKGSALEAGPEEKLGLAVELDLMDESILRERFKAGAKVAKDTGAAITGAAPKTPALAAVLADTPEVPAPPTLEPAGRPARDLAKARKELAALEETEGVRATARVPTAAYRRRVSRAGERGAIADDEFAFFAGDADRRGRARQLYRKLDKTKEWAENNYYRLTIDKQNAELITVNGFWRDYAQFLAGNADGEFQSPNLAEASRNFPEMMLALAVLELPFKAEEHQTDLDDATLTIKPASPLVLYHREIKEARPAQKNTPILVSQNFFRLDDRYYHENNERFDKYVSDEFLINVVYGCQVVVTNPTSSKQKLDILLQIPRGAIPVKNSLYTKSQHLELPGYHTQTYEYYFYFPAPGERLHYPVHVAKNEELVAFAEPVTLKVVEEPSTVDKTSWPYLSQWGSDQDVVDYLNRNNIDRLDLEKIAWRMRDKAHFQKIIALLHARHVYHNTLWSYGIKHNVVPAVREFLQFQDAFVKQCGAFLDSPLLTIDPVLRKAYQHLEYSPLVNARAHRLGPERKILNNRFAEQYQRLMTILRYRKALDDDDLMAITYYMLLQDRIEEALKFFGRVDAKKLETRLQYDYFTAYLDFFNNEPKAAAKLAKQYADYPVERWRRIFATVAAQLEEIKGEAGTIVDEKDRTQQQDQLAATEPAFDFKVEAKEITINYQNITSCMINYYLMDVELLFSRNPFVQQFSGQFSSIRPNDSETKKLSARKSDARFELPKKFHTNNVMVEIVAGGLRKSQAYYSHSLNVQLIEEYGQVRVTQAGGEKPLSKVYVKVYARMKDGRVRFYKDGYTDLRGRFDYTSLNTNEIDFVDRFALLILSETGGAVVREAAPPKR